MTDFLSQLSWEHAKGQIAKHPDITADAAFGYTLDKGECYRYVAQYTWDASRPVLIACMANPSTATHLRLDPTVSGMIARARAWEYGSLMVINAFAYRATDPKDMYLAANGGFDVVGPANDGVLRSAFQRVALQTALCVVGWGKIGAFKNRAGQVLAIAKEVGAPLHALQINADGSPKHPLYVARRHMPVRWPAV